MIERALEKVDDLMMPVRDAELQRGKMRLEILGQIRDHRIFCAEVICVDQSDTGLRSVQKTVIFHICSHIGVTALRDRVFQRSTASSSHDSEFADRSSAVHITDPYGIETLFAARHELRR